MKHLRYLKEVTKILNGRRTKVLEDRKFKLPKNHNVYGLRKTMKKRDSIL